MRYAPVVLALLPGLAARGQESERRPEIVTIAEATGKVARNSEAAMVELADGSLFMVWQEFEKGEGDSDFFPNRLVAMTSRDGGRTWGERRVVVETEPGDVNVYSPSLLRLPDGAILFCFMRYHSFARAENKYPPASAFAWLSRDEARTFTPFATLWKEKPVTISNSTLVRLATGRIVLPVCRDQSRRGEPDHWEAGAWRSDDGGKTWEEATDWVDLPKRGAMEPHVAERRDSRLLMVMRTQLGAVYRSESADGGRTWSEGASLGIEAPESCPDLVRIPTSGDLLLVWNASRYDPAYASHFGKRTPLSVAVSRDDGRTWSPPRHLETDPGWAFSNPGTCFTRRGTVVISYWACRYLPSGAMTNFPIHLKAAIADLAWLRDDVAYERAELARKENRGAEALELFHALIEAHPDHVDGHVGYQKLLQSQGKEAELIREYEAFLAAGREPWRAYLLGRLLHDPAREEALYRPALDAAPEDFRLRLALASALRRQQRPAEAEVEYREALRLRPDSQEAHVALMYLLEEGGRLDELRETYRRRLLESPGSSLSQLLAGYACTMAGDAEEGGRCLRRAVELSPEDPDVLLGAATLHLKEQRLDEAQRYLEKVQRLDPHNWKCLHKLGLLHLFLRREPGGLELLQEAARLEPADPDLHVKLGLAHALGKRFEAAERAFREALRLDPTAHDALSQMGMLHGARGEPLKAIECFEKAIRIDGRAADYYVGLAQAYRDAKMFDRARAALEKASSLRTRADVQVVVTGEKQEIVPRSAIQAKQLGALAESLAMEGKFDEAKRRFGEALTADPRLFRPHAALARIHVKLGELEEALGVYRRLAKLCEVKEEYRNFAAWTSARTADCLYDLGRKAEALELCRAALGAATREEPARSALEDLVKAIEAPPPDAEVFRLPGVRIRECAAENYCLPKSLAAVLEHWGAAADVEALGRDLVPGPGGALSRDAVDHLRRREGFDACCFTASPGRLKTLLKRGFPIVLMYSEVVDGAYRGHASVVAGFDDARQVFLLEDSNWFAGADRISYDRADGARALLAAPGEKLAEVKDSLPDRDYHEKLNRAEALFYGADPEPVRALLVEALELRADDYLAHLYLGAVCEAQGDLQSALIAYKESARLSPALARPLAGIASIHLLRRETDEAEEALRAVVAMEPWLASARLPLFRILREERKKPEEALVHLERLLEIRPREGQYHYWKAEILLEKGRKDEALAAFLLAADFGGPPETYLNLGQLHAGKGEYALAIGALEKYRELAADPEARAKVGELLETLRRQKAAK